MFLKLCLLVLLFQISQISAKNNENEEIAETDNCQDKDRWILCFLETFEKLVHSSKLAKKIYGGFRRLSEKYPFFAELRQWLILLWLDKDVRGNGMDYAKLLKQIKDRSKLNYTQSEAEKYSKTLKFRKNFYLISNETDTWYNATQKCSAAGMSLVSIFNKKENSDLHQAIRNHPSIAFKSIKEDFWIGGKFMPKSEIKNLPKRKKLADEFAHAWYPSKNIFRYTQWDNFHPLNDKNKACVKFRYRQSGSTWRNAKCSKLYRYVCQKSRRSL